VLTVTRRRVIRDIKLRLVMIKGFKLKVKFHISPYLHLRGLCLALKEIKQKTLVYGEKTLMTKFLLKKGSTLSRHTHPHEQAGYLVKGHIRLLIGAEECDAQAGDSWCIPGGVEHGAESMEDSVVIEVFSPVRKDYLPKERENE